jgi:hypothetical protein
MINIDSFTSYCKTLIGKRLETLWLHRPFRLKSASQERFDWIVESSGKPRYSKRRYLESYLQRYRETKSLRPKDYKILTTIDNKQLKTTDASYILTLIDLYMKQNVILLVK